MKKAFVIKAETIRSVYVGGTHLSSVFTTKTKAPAAADFTLKGGDPGAGIGAAEFEAMAKAALQIERGRHGGE